MPRNLADQNDQSISQDWADRDKFRGLVTSPSLLSFIERQHSERCSKKVDESLIRLKHFNCHGYMTIKIFLKCKNIRQHLDMRKTCFFAHFDSWVIYLHYIINYFVEKCFRYPLNSTATPPTGWKNVGKITPNNVLFSMSTPSHPCIPSTSTRFLAHSDLQKIYSRIVTLMKMN